MQVTGQVRADISLEQATGGPIDPVNIPWQVRIRRLRRRSGDAGACRSIRVLSHHRQGYAVRKPCLHLPGVDSHDLIHQIPDCWIRPQSSLVISLVLHG
jgi:hypothetical protein